MKHGRVSPYRFRKRDGTWQRSNRGGGQWFTLSVTRTETPRAKREDGKKDYAPIIKTRWEWI